MLSRDQVQHYISMSDAFVLTSRYETFGVVLAEATALGRPVIATRCGGPESIVSDGDGYLVDVDNVEELAAAMVQLVDNIKQFEPDSIRMRCAKRFSAEVVTTQLKEAYCEVISSNRRVQDRNRDVQGKSVSVRVDPGGRRLIKQQTTTKT